jgi:osmotically-inducible protein OsmY
MAGQLNHDANALAADAAKTIDNVLEAPRRARGWRESMRFLNNVLTVGLVGVVLVAGPARAASAGQQAAPSATTKVDDSTLKSRIAANLKKNATMAAREVETAGERARAARLATVRGVTEVRNEIVVDAAAVKSRAGQAIDATRKAGGKAADVTKDAAQKTGEQSKETAATAATKTKEAASATGEAISDGWITMKVKTKFFDEKLLKDSDINVVTTDYVVTLKGTMTSRDARARHQSRRL